MSLADKGRWDTFVLSHPEGTFFHRAGWAEVIERAFGHRTHFLLAESGGALCGVLPLAHVRSRLFGNTLSSTPFCVYGGALTTSDAAQLALEREAIRLAEKLGVGQLELRHRRERHPDWPRKDLYVTFAKEIEPDPESNLKAIPRKQRAMVRKGIQAGLQAETEPDVERFFLAYSESVRSLGTPVFSKHYFSLLRQVFGDDSEVLTISLDGRLIGSVLSFYFRDQVLPYYGGGTAEARQVKGNDFMYWTLMCRAAQRGIRWFDFGRSKINTGSYHFKKNWGFEPEPLHYEYHLVRSRAVPDVNPLNPKYRLFIAIWKRMPLALSRMLGPMIARNLG
jgi:FemAB-related protein (PEP-CTERM system-associated)